MSFMLIGSFVFCTALVSFITFLKTRNENLDTSTGYFLAGRSLKAPVIAGSLMLTNLSANNFVGMSAEAYSTNMSNMGWEVVSGLALVIVALFLLPRYLKQGITTIPEFINARFDHSTKSFVTILFLISYIVNLLPVTLYSGAVAISQIFGIEEMLHITYAQSIWVTVWIIGIIGSIYAIFGGLRAVAVSDSLNGIALVVGGLAVPFFGLIYLGHGNFSEGFNAFLATTPEKFNSVGSSTDPVPFGTLFTGLILVALYYWGTDQAIIQRALGAQSLKEGQKGVIFAGFLKVLTPLILVLPGIIAFQIFGNQFPDNSDIVYSALVNTVLPKPLVGFFAAAMLGAILSTFNSVLNSASTLFALDIFKPKWGQNYTDAQLVKVGQRFGIVVAIISMIIAPMIMNAPNSLFTYFQTINGFFNVPIFTVILMGYVTKRVSAIAAKIGLGFFVVVYGITQLFWDTGLHYLHISGILFIVSSLLMILISKKYPSKSEFSFEGQNCQAAVDVHQWQYRYRASAVVIFAMVTMYIIFSPIGLASAAGLSMTTLAAIAVTGILCAAYAYVMERRDHAKSACLKRSIRSDSV